MGATARPLVPSDGSPGPSETIAAIATPPGRGGVGIVRISGPKVQGLARALLGTLPEPRRAALRDFRDPGGEVLDQGLALYFPAPRSYTGEDVLELHAHGGPIVLDMLLEACLRAGARAAQPGEFSRRAYLHGKLDLAQSEAVADLIESDSRQAVRSARRALEGAFSREVQALSEALAQARTRIEADIDFAEEEVEALEHFELSERLAQSEAALDALLDQAHQGRLLRDGMTVVIAGPPNVGKSSLLNALARRDAAIVSHLPGTTRDLLRERIHLNGVPLHVLDTAGLRATDDPVERIGVERARKAIEEADAILAVLDDQAAGKREEQGLLAGLPEGPQRVLVHNKIDLTGHAPGHETRPDGERLWLSAKTGLGLDLLERALSRVIGYHPAEGVFMARARHLEALRAARAGVRQARTLLRATGPVELIAEELRLAQGHLGEITGQLSTEDLLDRIFSTFCIGK